MLDIQKINQITDPKVRRQLKMDILAKAKIQKQTVLKNDFLSFVKHVWPEFVEGYHHKKISDAFNRIQSGDLKRLIINMPPRHTKSEFASYFLPAWMIGNKPNLKIIQATHTAELAIRFGRKAKTLMDSDEYKELFVEAGGETLDFVESLNDDEEWVQAIINILGETNV